jgi:hypothetical protein
MPETRSSANKYDLKYRMYRHEMDEAGHTRLLEKLQRLDGCVALSGSACPLYDERLHDWHRVETAAHADGARPRTEMLWLNAACWQRLEAERGADLFLSLPLSAGAGEGNRTLVCSLGSCRSTIELRPRTFTTLPTIPRPLSTRQRVRRQPGSGWLPQSCRVFTTNVFKPDALCYRASHGPRTSSRQDRPPAPGKVRHIPVWFAAEHHNRRRFPAPWDRNSRL